MATNFNEEPEAMYKAMKDDRDAVPVTKSNDPQHKKYRAILMIVLLLSLAALVSGQAYYSITHFVFGEDGAATRKNNLKSYVFSNTSLVVFENTDTSIEGGFIVNDIHYEFKADFRSLSFIEVSAAPIGFTVADRNESDALFVIEFIESGTVYTTEVSPGEPVNMTVVDMLMDSVLVKHFVELSAKLGAAGYIGPRGNHLQGLHRFAQWMYQYEVMSMDHEELITYQQWNNMTVEFEKVNAIVSASANAGYWVNTMDELIEYTSSEYSQSGSGSGRALLGNCGSVYSQCGNDCMGRCGVDCSCWSWVCGDCNCWEGCRLHDHYCSCEGPFDYCCIDTLWISCEGSSDSIC